MPRIIAKNIDEKTNYQYLLRFVVPTNDFSVFTKGLFSAYVLGFGLGSRLQQRLRQG